MFRCIFIKMEDVKIIESEMNNLSVMSNRNVVTSKDIEKVVEILKSIDWKVLESVYNTFGNSLNSNDMKNLKGKVKGSTGFPELRDRLLGAEIRKRERDIKGGQQKRSG